MLKRISGLIFISILSILLFACGGGGGSSAPAGDGGTGGGDVVVEDDIAPAISTLSPVDGATDIEATAILSATFNEDMLATSFITSDWTGRFSLFSSNNREGLVVGGFPGVVNFDALTNTVTFTPKKPLTLLTRYTAYLSEDITDLSGNTLPPTSWSFTTRDGAWGAPEFIETDDAGDADSPQIAMNANGYAMAVWRQSDGTRNNIMVRPYTPGAGWGETELIETNDANANDPQTAVDANGNAIVVWEQTVRDGDTI